MLRMKKGDVPLDPRKWTPLLEEVVLGLETLESCDGGGGTDVFSSKREGGGATWNVPAERKIEIFITRAQGQSGNLILCLFGRPSFKRWQS